MVLPAGSPSGPRLISISIAAEEERPAMRGVPRREACIGGSAGRRFAFSKRASSKAAVKISTMMMMTNFLKALGLAGALPLERGGSPQPRNLVPPLARAKDSRPSVRVRLLRAELFARFSFSEAVREREGIMQIQTRTRIQQSLALAESAEDPRPHSHTRPRARMLSCPCACGHEHGRAGVRADTYAKPRASCELARTRREASHLYS